MRVSVKRDVNNRPEGKGDVPAKKTFTGHYYLAETFHSYWNVVRQTGVLSPNMYIHREWGFY